MEEVMMWLTILSWVVIALWVIHLHDLLRLVRATRQRQQDRDVSWQVMADRFAAAAAETRDELEKQADALNQWHALIQLDAAKLEADRAEADNYIVTALWHLEGKKDQ